MAAAWRYVPPNAVTACSLVLATVAIEQAIAGRVVTAAWLALVCMVTDKLDGLLAGALHASSEFGVQLDSLADLVSFGVAPAAIYYAFFRARAEWSGGWALPALCAFHVLAVALRLARFNVAAGRGPAPKHYYGIPSTMTAGTLLALFLFAVKYSSAPEADTVDRWRLPLVLSTDGLLRWAPLAFLGGAVAMLSRLRVPKVGRTRSRVLDVLELLGLVIGVVGIFARQFPEYLVAGTVVYVAVCVIYHLRTTDDPPPANPIL
jgi:CDP-diacylglycerol--serine O-phosphatidyltransferase